MHTPLHIQIAADRHRTLLADAHPGHRRAVVERSAATQNIVPRIPEKRITVTVSSSLIGRL
jgi:hypothetical protein